MKPMTSLLIFPIVLLTLSSQAKAIQTITIGGNGCQIATGDHALSPVSGTRYRIPLNLDLQKSNLVTIARKSCLFRLPVDLAANEKVVIHNLSQSIKLAADKNVSVQTQLEVFIAGTAGKPLITQIKASSKSSKLSKTVKSSGIVAQSACGQSVVVAGNLSVNATGAAKASAAISALDVSIAIEKCN